MLMISESECYRQLARLDGMSVAKRIRALVAATEPGQSILLTPSLVGSAASTAGFKQISPFSQIVNRALQDTHLTLAVRSVVHQGQLALRVWRSAF